MSINNLSTKISSYIEERKIELELIQKVEIEKIENEYNKDFSKFQNDLKKEYFKKKENHRIITYTQMNKKLRNYFLSKKKKMFDNFFDSLKKEIDNLDKNKIKRLFEKYYKIGKKELNIIKIYTDKTSYEIIKKLTSSSIDIKIKPDFSGFIFTNKDETELINLSYENIFCELIDENMAKIEKTFII